MTEEQIPKFLRIMPNEEKKELSRFAKLIESYEDKFHDMPTTEPWGYTVDELCMILEECIKKGKTVEELLGIEFSDDWDY